MDEVLTRLLAVENEADELFSRAEVEAERLLAAGRAKLSDERDVAHRKIEERARELVESREAQAREQRDSMLADVDRRLAEWQDGFDDQRLTPAVAVVVQTLITGVATPSSTP